jgi:hypothetical protein
VWPARTRYVLNGRLQASRAAVVPLLRTTALMCYGSALVVCAVIRDSHYHSHGVQPGRAQALPPCSQHESNRHSHETGEEPLPEHPLFVTDTLL